MLHVRCKLLNSDASYGVEHRTVVLFDLQSKSYTHRSDKSSYHLCTTRTGVVKANMPVKNGAIYFTELPFTSVNTIYALRVVEMELEPYSTLWHKTPAANSWLVAVHSSLEVVLTYFPTREYSQLYKHLCRTVRGNKGTWQWETRVFLFPFQLLTGRALSLWQLNF